MEFISKKMYCGKVLAVTAVLILIAVVAVGCGVSGSETPETTTSAQSEATSAIPESTTTSPASMESLTEPQTKPPTGIPTEPSVVREPSDELPEDEQLELIEVAVGFLNDVAEGNFGKCIELFDERMKSELPEDEFIRAWSSVIVRVGCFQSVIQTDYAYKDGFNVIRLSSMHLSGEVASTICFSSERKISGLFFETMDNVDADEGGSGDAGLQGATIPDSIIEENVVIGEGTKYPLRGKLTLPKDAGSMSGSGSDSGSGSGLDSGLDSSSDSGSGSGLDSSSGGIPAVVLVHGSDTLDMDVTIGANKIFRDIAWALAEKGVAVLRYDKRTYSYPGTLDDDFGSKLTVNEVQVEDAIFAKKLLISDSRINSDAILVAGHDMGGMIAPRILDEGEYAGAIILAGSPRSFVDITIDQMEYLISIGYISEEDAAIQRSIDESQYEAYKDLASEDDEYAMETIIFGISGYFLKEMEEHETSDYFNRIDKPILIMQGLKDFQFSFEKDFKEYQELAKNRANIEFIIYENLNHLFIRSLMETPDLTEYQVAGTVDSQVTDDIANWIAENFSN